MNDGTEDQKKILDALDNMSQEEREEYISNRADDAKKSIYIDALGKFILLGLQEKEEGLVASVLLSVIVNLGINKEMCPICFSDNLADLVKELFKEVDTGNDNHGYEFTDAKKISEIMRDGDTSH